MRKQKVKVCLAKRNRIILEVIDDGIGINDTEKNIFGIDFIKQINQGLQLKIILQDQVCLLPKKIVKLHDGKIAVLDNKPKGTRFVVNL